MEWTTRFPYDERPKLAPCKSENLEDTGTVSLIDNVCEENHETKVGSNRPDEFHSASWWNLRTFFVFQLDCWHDASANSSADLHEQNRVKKSNDDINNFLVCMVW